ncbi:MAG: hypothetical protein ACRC6T_01760 [Sarcina sp.]
MLRKIKISLTMGILLLGIILGASQKVFAQEVSTQPEEKCGYSAHLYKFNGEYTNQRLNTTKSGAFGSIDTKYKGTVNKTNARDYSTLVGVQFRSTL